MAVNTSKYKTILSDFQIYILFFFIFGSLFPTIRILLIGSETSKNILEYFISSLFDLAAISIILYSAFRIIKEGLVYNFTFFDWIVFIFIISNVILGTALSQNIKLSMYGFRMTYLPALFYFIIRINKLDCKQIENLTKKIYYWFFIIAVIGIVLYFGFYSSMIEMIYRAGGVVNKYFITRMTSVFWSPVLFATFMTSTFLYFYYRATLKSNWRNYIVLSLLWTCILLSVTRGALIILLIGLLLLTLYSQKWNVLAIMVVIMTLLFVCISYYIGSPLEFIEWIIKSSASTISLEKGVTRVDLWIKAFSDFKEHSMGYGLGKAGHVAARFFVKSSSDASSSSTDGWFLKLAGETGVWGLISYFTLAITFIINSSQYIKRNSYGLFTFLFILFLVINIQCLVSNVNDFYLFSYLNWLSLGMAVNIKSIRQ